MFLFADWLCAAALKRRRSPGSFRNDPYFLFPSPVARIALVKPEKARGVEDLVIRMAQMGQITEKVRPLVSSDDSLCWCRFIYTPSVAAGGVDVLQVDRCTGSL